MTTRKAKHSAGKLAQGLGWFSVGLGLAEAVAPGVMAEFIGMENKRNNRIMLRLFGLREIAAGVGLLTGKQKANWLWGRVSGDALDLTALGFAAESKRSDKGRLAAAAVAVGGVTILDILAAKQADVPEEAETTDIERSLTINGSAEALEACWRNSQNFARFMRDFAEVVVAGENLTQWTVHAPFGQTLRWNMETAPTRPGEAWRIESLPGSQLRGAMTLRFQPAPKGLGTEVFLRFRFDPMKGAAGAIVSHVPGMALDLMASKVLRNFKSLFESGEIPTLDGNPSARVSENGRRSLPALSGAGS